MRKKKSEVAMAISVALMATLPIQVSAQEESTIEKVIVTGTRMMDRSAADSPVPVDIISGDELRV
eukprot:CAMPEP_0119040674 /NCGR_PEP_ID=MMETSP1177-20130426/10692_1 /TAXON_ID=2985 /ORGANISM="Ochromonas sp, Strain CCMP1899" /LENGTH=64 /DNA_ID=CAMNT_0007005975 /DNA_START=186 /DNA_END=377 /DNA_ORIENTATION=-